MKPFFKTIPVLFLGISVSCSNNKNENTLRNEDQSFIRELGILDSLEEIELFESNGGFKGFKQSGNFITKKRIASYWIEDGEKEVHSAFFSTDIDSISQTDLVSKLTYASYLTVYKTDGSSFRVYVDADSVRTYQFFNKAKENWEKYRENK
ncbi:MAG: hypothetical protein K0S23_375 [Fluviicola sp.]|jgi:hypothetical protein|uniref:hypothetical protein n=1 Tax=Fluviicola sp. TaxID=1917219 RepID=UPI0026397D47|nr:hypothetical protein [Fluviicola sp.]MDF3026068.1 hypothetical protein [Fluviicola sp.]